MIKSPILLLSLTDSEVPTYIIVAGIVGGVLVTVIIIVICASMYCKANRKRKERELAKHQEKIKDNAIEMSSNSTTTTLGSKKGVPPVGYFSLPRSHGGKNYKDHRNSLTNSQSASEGDYPDQSSDQGTYKKFTVVDPYVDDETSPTLYNQTPCLTTIIERHDMPPQTELDGSYGWTGYGWKQPPSTLTENLAKLARYNMPQHEQHHPQKMYKYSPENKMYMDPKYEMYQEQKMLMNKDYKMKYGTPTDKESSFQDEHTPKQFQMKIQDPDITRDLEVT
jgi:hypothetical protein